MLNERNEKNLAAAAVQTADSMRNLCLGGGGGRERRQNRIEWLESAHCWPCWALSKHHKSSGREEERGREERVGSWKERGDVRWREEIEGKSGANLRDKVSEAFSKFRSRNGDRRRRCGGTLTTQEGGREGGMRWWQQNLSSFFLFLFSTLHAKLSHFSNACDLVHSARDKIPVL